MRNILLALTAALTLTACQGMGYAIQNYGSTPRLVWKDSTGKEFGIYDKPAENRMMVTASIGRAAADGATFGATRDPGQTYRDAAVEYLAQQDRRCTAISTTVIVEPQYEVTYSCQ